MTMLTKAAFAKRCNLSKGRISQYIRAGQLTAPALVGDGRDQKVDLELGREQLKLRLDFDQRMLNGLSTRLDDPKPAKTAEDRLAGNWRSSSRRPFRARHGSRRQARRK